jgi:hypothetical protein
MKFRIIIAGAALLAALIGVRCLTQYAHSPRRAAVGIATELASKMSEPPGGPFELIRVVIYLLNECGMRTTRSSFASLPSGDGYPVQRQVGQRIFEPTRKFFHVQG